MAAVVYLSYTKTIQRKRVMPNSIDDSPFAKIYPCPVCRKITRYTVDNPYRPFCSERCRMIDLGQWLEEDYRVAGEPAAHEVPDED